MSISHYDIIIVGGGLVGMILAHALRGHGLHLAIVDARPLPTHSLSNDGRSLALSYSSQQILAALEVWPALAKFATSIHSIHVSRQGVFAKTRMHASTLNLPALGYVVPANILANQVAKQVVAIPELTVYAPAMVQNLAVKPKSAHLTIVQNGQTRTLSARLIIAADGSQSTLAQQLHIHQEQYNYQQTAIVSTITVGVPHNNRAYERFTPQGVLALLPVRTHEFGVVWTTCNDQAQHLLALTPNEYLRELQKNIGQYWGTHVTLGERTSYPLTAQCAYEQIRPRVVILGNAAHTVHPVAAQGLNLALRAVAWLAETLLHAEDDIGDLTVLRQYLQQVENDQQFVQGATHGLAEMTSAINFNPLWNLGLGLFDKLPGVKRLFMRHAAGIAGKQSRLARGISLTLSNMH